MTHKCAPRTRAAVIATVAGLALAGCSHASPRATPTTHRAATTSTPAPPTTSTTTSAPPETTAAPTTSTSTSAPPATTAAAPATVPPTAPSADPPVGSTGGLSAVAGKTIVIDPGHDGGNGSHPAEISRMIFIGTGSHACDNTGTEANDGYPEHAYTFDVSMRLRALLAAAGAHVVMTRSNDAGVGPCIDERAYIGNRAHADAAISIHADGGPSGGRGSCVYMPALTPGYTDDIYAASHRLGVDLRDAYRDTSSIPVANYVCAQGLAEANNYGGLNLSNVPKVLFETANMRNATDAAVMEQGAGRQRIAAGIAAGLARFLAG